MIDEVGPHVAGSLVMKRRKRSGWFIGGVAKALTLLDFCAEHGVASDIELLSIIQAKAACGRTLAGEVRYCFVIRTAGLERD